MSKVLIIGMGKSGKAAYRFLQQSGHEPFGVEADSGRLAKLQDEGFDVAANRPVEEFDCIVVSPGVAPSELHYTSALASGKNILGEAELALSSCRQKCLAITGTNGKTTVTLLVEHILKEAGHKAKALGNVGEPLCDYFMKPDLDEILVVEVSSYQLETMHAKVFDAGVILNITADHLDRYATMEEYAKAKFRLQSCLKERVPLYINVKILKEFAHLVKEPYRTFGSASAAWLWTDKTVFKQVGNIEVHLPEEYATLGLHESENALAAWILCREMGISEEVFLRGLATFRKPEHRIEKIADIGGVLYYDDSKGTNVDATIQAVASMPGPVILIAGGVDKGGSYAPWIEPFSCKVKEIVVIGQAASKIMAELQQTFSIALAKTLEEAVLLAAQKASAGDAVLLSPGCSSFDMFRDYAHRGEVFRKCVENLRPLRYNS